MKTLILAAFTARELVLKATMLVLAGISTVILLFVLAGVSTVTTPEGTSIVLFSQQGSPPLSGEALAVFVRGFEASSASGLFAGVILFGVLATAGLLPDTLEKGTVDIYLSKPLARAEVLAGRTTGAAAAIFLNTLYFLGGLWLILGLRTGVWDVHFLAAPLGMTYGFLCLYALVSFLGILSRNTAIAVIGAFIYQFVIVHVLQNRAAILYPLTSSEIVHRILDGAYYLFPQTGGVQESVTGFVSGSAIQWKPIATAFLSSAGWYAAGWWIMERSDY